MKGRQLDTLTNIYVNCGMLCSSQHIHHFLERNSEKLRDKSIYYSMQPDEYDVYKQHAQYQIVQDSFLPFDEFTKKLDETVFTNLHLVPHHTTSTLILSCPFLYRRHEALKFLSTYLRERCPNAKQRFFVSFVPQYQELEAFTTFVAWWQSCPELNCIPAFLHDEKDRHLFYDTFLASLKESFGEDVHACMVTNGRDALNAFLSYIGVLMEDVKTAGLDITPPPYLLESQPSHFLACTNHLNGIQDKDSPSHVGEFLWSTQAPYFAPASTTEPTPMFGHAWRTSIHKFYATSNRRLARMLGYERAFPHTEIPEQPTPATLSVEQVNDVVDKLDMPIVQSLFDAVQKPARPTSYLHRLIMDAIKRRMCSNVSDAPDYKVSVLTLAYRHEQYIADCIESVLAQKTSFSFEHIIVDDGSDDKTAEIIAAYAQKHPHIHPIYLERRRNFNNVRYLFAACHSPYAALCDGDDYYTDPLKLQTQADFLDANPDCALCFHPVKVVYEDGSKRGHVYPPLDQLPRGIKPFYYLSDLLKCNLIQTNSVMYRWRFRDGLPAWFRPDCCPGDWYWHLLHAELGKIGFINEVMSVYRRHEEGIYYLSEVDRLKHRAKVGQEEIEVYNVINKHFGRKYESILLDLVNGVFADCLMYDTQRAEEDGAEPILPKLVEMYPDFARHFLNSLKVVSSRGS